MTNTVNQKMISTIYVSYCILALFIFISFSITAGYQFIALIPAIYFMIKKPLLTKGGLFLLLLSFWLAVTMYLNQDNMLEPLRTSTKLKYYLIPVLVIPATLELIKNITHKQIKILIHLFVWGGTIATVSGYIGLVTGFNPLRMKQACTPLQNCGMYGLQISYGYGIAIFATFLTSMLFYKDKLKEYISTKPLIIAVAINLILGVYFSYSRGGILSLLVSAPAILYFGKRKLFYAVYGCVFALIITAVVLSIKQTSHFKKTNEVSSNRIVQRTDTRSNMARIGQLKGVFFASLDKPLIGYGFRTFEKDSVSVKKKYEVKEHPDHKGHAHNNYAEFLYSAGYPALLFLLGWMFYWFFTSATGPWYLNIFLPTILCIASEGMFQSTLIDGENLYLIFGLFIAFEGLKLHNNKKEQE